MLSREAVSKIRELYPAGTRIRLIKMYDNYHPVKPGTKGTVMCIDDSGKLLMKWDNHRSLALIPDYDEFEVIGKGD